MSQPVGDPMPEASVAEVQEEKQDGEEEDEEEEVKEMVPDMELAMRCWVAVRKSDRSLAAGIMEVIKEKNMAPWYSSLSQQHPGLFPLDEALLAKMKETNEADAKRISELIYGKGASPANSQR